MQYGANPNIQNDLGESALYSAVHKHCPKYANNIEIICLLLQHGANPNIQNSSGKTIFDIAKTHKFVDFTHLVRIYSQNTLKKICLHAIFMNLHLLEGELDILPTELKEEINNLRS